jgi:hypothetical protein
MWGNPGGDLVGCDPGMSLTSGVVTGILYPGENNISEDSMFCGDINCPNGPYSLDINSPCAARNSLDGHQIGAYGVGCSGPVKTRTITWGAIKAIYR